jgi:hypothetical protein
MEKWRLLASFKPRQPPLSPQNSGDALLCPAEAETPLCDIHEVRGRLHGIFIVYNGSKKRATKNNYD